MAAPCCVPQFLVIPGHARTPGSSAQRVLARLADEHGVTAISYSTVRDYVARRPARALRALRHRFLAHSSPVPSPGTRHLAVLTRPGFCQDCSRPARRLPGKAVLSSQQAASTARR
jgi:hypothetical protein